MIAERQDESIAAPWTSAHAAIRSSRKATQRQGRVFLDDLRVASDLMSVLVTGTEHEAGEARHGGTPSRTTMKQSVLSMIDTAGWYGKRGVL